MSLGRGRSCHGLCFAGPGGRRGGEPGLARQRPVPVRGMERGPEKDWGSSPPSFGSSFELPGSWPMKFVFSGTTLSNFSSKSLFHQPSQKEPTHARVPSTLLRKRLHRVIALKIPSLLPSPTSSHLSPPSNTQCDCHLCSLPGLVFSWPPSSTW